MPSRYYFAPVGGQKGSVMSGVAGGIMGGLDAFQGAQAETARQEEVARRRQMEDLKLDIDLAQMGGGRGQAPEGRQFGPVAQQQRDVTPPSMGIGMQNSGAQMPGFFPPGLSRDGTPPGGPGRTPNFFERPDVFSARASNVDEGRYDQMGDFYLENRDWRAQRNADDAANAAMARRGAIGSALTGVRGDLDPARAHSAAYLLDEGIGTYNQLLPEEERPFDPNTNENIQIGEYWRSQGLSVTGQPLEAAGTGEWRPRTEEEWFRSRGRDPVTGALLPSGGGTPTAPTYAQAMTQLRALYPQPRYDDDPQPPPPEVLHQMALRMAAGEDPAWPQVVPGAPTPGPGGAIARFLPMGESGYEAPRYEMPAPAPEPQQGGGNYFDQFMRPFGGGAVPSALDPSEAMRRQIQQILRDNPDASEEDIERMLNGERQAPQNTARKNRPGG